MVPNTKHEMYLIKKKSYLYHNTSEKVSTFLSSFLSDSLGGFLNVG